MGKRVGAAVPFDDGRAAFAIPAQGASGY